MLQRASEFWEHRGHHRAWRVWVHDLDQVRVCPLCVSPPACVSLAPLTHVSLAPVCVPEEPHRMTYVQHTCAQARWPLGTLLEVAATVWNETALSEAVRSLRNHAQHRRGGAPTRVTPAREAVDEIERLCEAIDSMDDEAEDYQGPGGTLDNETASPPAHRKFGWQCAGAQPTVLVHTQVGTPNSSLLGKIQETRRKMMGEFSWEENSTAVQPVYVPGIFAAAIEHGVSSSSMAEGSQCMRVTAA